MCFLFLLEVWVATIQIAVKQAAAVAAEVLFGTLHLLHCLLLQRRAAAAAVIYPVILEEMEALPPPLQWE